MSRNTWNLDDLFDEVCLPVRAEAVYHYGSPATAHAIASGSPLRASLSTVLNDTSEVETGRKAIGEYLEKERLREHEETLLVSILPDIEENEAARGFSRSADIWVRKEAWKDLGNPTMEPVTRIECAQIAQAAGDHWLQSHTMYVLCASSVKDRLSQWRAYGSCVMALDPSIKFEVIADLDTKGSDVSASEEAGIDESLNISLRWRQVLYTGTAELERALLDFCNSVERLFLMACAGDISEGDAENWSIQFYVHLVGLIKDRTFIEEAEVRLLVVGPEEQDAIVKVREGAYGLSPYVEVQPVSPSARISGPYEAPRFLRSIHLGPGVSSNDEQVLIYLLLGRKSVPVEKMVAPAVLDR